MISRKLRTLSAVVATSFLIQDFSYAALDMKPTEIPFLQAPLVSFELPKSVAVIGDTYKGTSGETIILVQDAHTNDSAQINTSKALDLILQNEQIPYVYLEAASGNSSLAIVRDKAPLEKRKQVAMKYLRKGTLDGVEYLDMTSDHAFIPWGVEDKKLYLESLHAYEKVAKNREKFRTYLSEVSRAVETIKPLVYGASLQEFDQKRLSFLKNKTALTDYIEVLMQQMSFRNIAKTHYPHLLALSSLKEREKAIDFDKASDEQSRAMDSLSEEDQQMLEEAAMGGDDTPFRLSVQDHKTQKAFYALLEEKLGVRSSEFGVDYPELAKYFEYLKDADKVDAKAVLEEKKFLEEEIYASLAKTSDEVGLHKADEAVQFLQKLFDLTVTPDEFRAYKQDKDAFDIKAVTGFLNRKIMDLGDHYDRVTFLKDDYEEYVRSAESFYRLTYERDMAFLDNMHARMKQEGQKTAVLVTGGYHTPNLAGLLQDKNTSYIVVTPQVLNETNKKKYESLLLGQNEKDILMSDDAASQADKMDYFQSTVTQMPALQELGITRQALIAFRSNMSVRIERAKAIGKQVGNQLIDLALFKQSVSPSRNEPRQASSIAPAVLFGAASGARLSDGAVEVKVAYQDYLANPSLIVSRSLVQYSVQDGQQRQYFRGTFIRWDNNGLTVSRNGDLDTITIPNTSKPFVTDVTPLTQAKPDLTGARLADQDRTALRASVSSVPFVDRARKPSLTKGISAESQVAYTDKLLAKGLITPEEANRLKAQAREQAFRSKVQAQYGEVFNYSLAAQIDTEIQALIASAADMEPAAQVQLIRDITKWTLDSKDNNLQKLTASGFVRVREAGVSEPVQAAISFALNQLPYSEVAGSRLAQLSPVQKDSLDKAASLFNLSPAGKGYLAEMFRQYHYPDSAPKQIVVDRNNPDDKGNFQLASTLTEDEVLNIMKVYEYLTLDAEPANIEAAKNVVVTVNSMDGGIGENMGRLQELIARAKKAGLPTENIRMGAKGTDLGDDLTINGQTYFVSIAERKLNQLIILAKENKFSNMKFQPLVNWQSKASYDALLDSVYLFDKADPTAPQRTYRQVFTEVGIEILPMLEQEDLPGIDKSTGLISSNPEAPRQPGGHGQWGFYFFHDIFTRDIPADGKTHIRIFLNGDNNNSRANAAIAGAMARNRWPLVKLVTPATLIDKKGGKDGVRVIQIAGTDVLVRVPDQMELADAKAVGQTDLFQDAGQEGGIGRVGKQPFNTNMIYFNETELQPILRELGDIIGAEELEKVFSPTLIRKDAKKGKDGGEYIPVDAAIGVAVHNLNTYFMTSQDPRVRAILENRGLDRLLFFVNIPRILGFTPNKNNFDLRLQQAGGFYDFNIETMAYEEKNPGRPLPEVEFISLDANGKDDKYWNEQKNYTDAFTGAEFSQLHSLSVFGKISAVNAVFIGSVSIRNESSSVFDLNSLRSAHSELFTDSKLILRNTDIKIDKDQNVTIISKPGPIAQSEIDDLNATKVDSAQEGVWRKVVKFGGLSYQIRVNTDGTLDIMDEVGTLLRKQNSSFTLGRSEANDFRTPYGIVSVSRSHAKFDYDQASKTWSLNDLGSTLGTFVDGVKIEPNKPLALSSGARLASAKQRLAGLIQEVGNRNISKVLSPEEVIFVRTLSSIKGSAEKLDAGLGLGTSLVGRTNEISGKLERYLRQTQAVASKEQEGAALERKLRSKNPDTIRALPISVLRERFDTRTRKVLDLLTEFEDVHYIGNLADLHPIDVLRMRNAGFGAIKNFQRALEAYGLSLTPQTDFSNRPITGHNGVTYNYYQVKSGLIKAGLFELLPEKDRATASAAQGARLTLDQSVSPEVAVARLRQGPSNSARLVEIPKVGESSRATLTPETSGLRTPSVPLIDINAPLTRSVVDTPDALDRFVQRVGDTKGRSFALLLNGIRVLTIAAIASGFELIAVGRAEAAYQVPAIPVSANSSTRPISVQQPDANMISVQDAVMEVKSAMLNAEAITAPSTSVPVLISWKLSDIVDFASKDGIVDEGILRAQLDMIAGSMASINAKNPLVQSQFITYGVAPEFAKLAQEAAARKGGLTDVDGFKGIVVQLENSQNPSGARLSNALVQPIYFGTSADSVLDVYGLGVYLEKLVGSVQRGFDTMSNKFDVSKLTPGDFSDSLIQYIRSKSSDPSQPITGSDILAAIFEVRRAAIQKIAFRLPLIEKIGIRLTQIAKMIATLGSAA